MMRGLRLPEFGDVIETKVRYPVRATLSAKLVTRESLQLGRQLVIAGRWRVRDNEESEDEGDE